MSRIRIRDRHRDVGQHPAPVMDRHLLGPGQRARQGADQPDPAALINGDRPRGRAWSWCT